MSLAWHVAVVALLLVAVVDAYPTRVPCNRALTVGTNMMGAAATGSASAVEFRRNGIAVTGTLRHDRHLHSWRGAQWGLPLSYLSNAFLTQLLSPAGSHRALAGL